MTEPMITTIFGPKFTAKTSTALSGQKPIAYYNLELGGSRAWHWKELVADNVVRERRVIIPGKDLIKRWSKLEGYIEAWKTFVTLLEIDLLDDSIATIVFDTGTMVRALAVDSFLEYRQNEVANQNREKRTLDVFEYAEPNRRTEDVIIASKRAGKDLVVIYHDTDEYVAIVGDDGKVKKDSSGNVLREQTGQKVPDGYKRAESDSDWVLLSSLAIKLEEGKKVVTPKMEILKSPYGLDLYGMSVEWA